MKGTLPPNHLDSGAEMTYGGQYTNTQNTSFQTQPINSVA